MEAGRLNARFYTRFFSVHILLALLGGLCLALLWTPVSGLRPWKSFDNDLSLPLGYLGAFLLACSFRGNYPSLKALHKVAAVFLGIIPTGFLLMELLFIPVIVFLGFPMFNRFFGHPCDIGLLEIILAMLPLCAVSILITLAAWLVIVRVIFAQYEYPYDLDRQSKFAMVAVLLLFLGQFGVHRFFVGRILSGALYLLTCGFAGVGVAVDGVQLMRRRFVDSDGNAI